MEMQRTVNRVSSAKFYFELYTLIIHLGFLGLTNDDYFIFLKNKHDKTVRTYNSTNKNKNSNNETLYYLQETNRVMGMNSEG